MVTFAKQKFHIMASQHILLNAVTTLLDANNAMGEKLQKLEKIAGAYDDLKVRYDKLEGEL